MELLLLLLALVAATPASHARETIPRLSNDLRTSRFQSMPYTRNMRNIARIGELSVARRGCMEHGRGARATNNGMRDKTGSRTRLRGIFDGFFDEIFDAGTKREEAKNELLSVIAPLSKGDGATLEQQEEVDTAARRLEKMNPNPSPLKTGQLSDKWELIYTTSAQILCTNRPSFLKPKKFYQTLDVENLKGKNEQIGFLGISESVTADLTPLNSTSVFVKFKEFALGPLKFKAPDFFIGELRTTYLDETMRVTRGDKGNLFVLLRTN